jgi:hypothetical protein
MGMSFFTSCPLTGGLSVPLQTMCTSNSSLSSRDFVRVSFDFAQDHELVEWHWFKAASQLVFVRAWLKKRHPHAHLPGACLLYKALIQMEDVDEIS